MLIQNLIILLLFVPKNSLKILINTILKITTKIHKQNRLSTKYMDNELILVNLTNIE